MKVYMNPEVFECAGAELHKDGVHIMNEDGSIAMIIASVGDIDSVEDGEITVVEAPEPTQADRIEAQVAYTAMMTDTLLEV